MDLNKALSEYQLKVETKLDSCFKSDGLSYRSVIEAMNYSLLLGGKRLRPAILLEFYKVCGGTDDSALNFAVALEMIHTYSLIHDDLPVMDNDDYRRGKPSCHKQFGEATALLAGDGLLTEAFRIAAETNEIKSEYIVTSIAVLAANAGVSGMIGGQVIDLESENKEVTVSIVEEMYRLKTGALLVAAATIGCILAGADENKINAAVTYAKHLGLAFQIVDDILDAIGDGQLLGKPIGSDDKNNKSTYVSLVGLEQAKKDVLTHTKQAKDALICFKDKAELLIQLADYLVDRKF